MSTIVDEIRFHFENPGEARLPGAPSLPPARWGRPGAACSCRPRPTARRPRPSVRRPCGAPAAGSRETWQVLSGEVGRAGGFALCFVRFRSAS